MFDRQLADGEEKMAVDAWGEGEGGGEKGMVSCFREKVAIVRDSPCVEISRAVALYMAEMISSLEPAVRWCR